MKIEKAKWEPVHRHGRLPSKSCEAVKALKPGDCKRIFHDDLICVKGKCSLFAVVSRCRKQGWVIEAYHEALHIAVVRRLK